MDNGEVIPGLNEDWSLAGAKMSEWVAGFMAFLISSEVIFTGKMARAMPFLILTAVLTTLGLAALRRMFPDEERGIRNAALTAIGVPPPGIPAPSAIQPVWSGCRIQEIRIEKKIRSLGILEAIDRRDTNGEDASIIATPRLEGLRGSRKG